MSVSTSSWESHIVEAAWLDAKIQSGDVSVVVVDMRGAVHVTTQPDGEQEAVYTGSKGEYAKGHIPGAVYLDWTEDITDPLDPIPVQVASADRISEVLSSVGIGDDTCIIAYDAHPSLQFATRLWWVCRYYGHANVRILNGGWNRWVAEGRPISTEVPKPEPAHFKATVQPDWRASALDVLDGLDSDAFVLIDARDEGQYTGKIKRGVRAGHIPGAINVPRELIFKSAGVLKTPEELELQFKNAGIPLNAERCHLAYCNGGVAATSVLFALSILGCTRLCNYDGSWNEWNAEVSLPVEL